MTHRAHPARRLLPAVFALAALAACTDRAPNPAAPVALEPRRAIADACPGLGDGCTPVTAVIDLASVDVGDAYIVSGDGTRYYVSWSTQFLPVALPPNPIIPTDPLYSTVISWNALVDSQSSYRSFLGQLRQLPPSPILPPNPVRFQATALTDGTSYFLTSLQPVLAEAAGT
jgi:hypothetical protein